jgi:hypothetical protein
MNNPKYKPYSYNWWWELGYQHCTNDSTEPKYPKVKPYLEGWFCKYDEADAWGTFDFLND